MEVIEEKVTDDVIPYDSIDFDFTGYDDFDKMNAVCADDIKPGCVFINLSNPIKKTEPVPDGEVYVCNFCLSHIENALTTYIEWSDKNKDTYCVGCYDKMIDEITKEMEWKGRKNE
jgi:hypothetical protein